MKAATKAKRRAVLALCGLGEMDESEVETVPRSALVPVDLDTGEIDATTAPALTAPPKPIPKPANKQQADAAPLASVLKKISEMREIAPSEWRARIDADVRACGKDAAKLAGLASEISRAITERDALETQ
jgi:hypothetical protein